MKRILLKISGEMLSGKKSFGYDSATVSRIAEDVKSVHDTGIQICLVIGGGNIYRGNCGLKNIDRVTSDYMGMIATVINALALKGALESIGLSARVQSAIPMSTICEQYVRHRALSHIESNRIVIFAGGTGNPFFTTDTAAVLRAIEMNCDSIFKGTSVDGIYSDDPKINPNAERIARLSYTEMLARNLRVMDASAVSLARDNCKKIVVFNLEKPNSFHEVVIGSSSDFSVIEEV